MAEKKLFVSYRRASWSFTYWLVEELGKLIDADIFVDYSGIDETNFESALLHHLRESDAVLLIVSEYTFDPARIHHDKDWVRREIREALTLNKPIVMACQNGQMPPSDLPDDIQAIRGVQGIEFYSAYFKAGVKKLARFLDKATSIKLLPSNEPSSPQSNQASTATPRYRAVLDDAIYLHEAGQYDQAIERYDWLISQQYQARLISISELRDRAIAERQAEQRRWEAGELYDEIATLFRIDPERGAKEYARFLAEYPDLTEDPAGLAQKATEAGKGISLSAQRSSSTLAQPRLYSIDPRESDLLSSDTPAEEVREQSNQLIGSTISRITQEGSESEVQAKIAEELHNIPTTGTLQHITLQQDLEITFVFTPEELQLNREGKLSQRQYRETRLQIISVSVVFSIVVLLLSLVVLWLQPALDTIRLIATCIPGFFVFCCGILIITLISSAHRLSSYERASSSIKQEVGGIRYQLNKNGQDGLTYINNNSVLVKNVKWGLYHLTYAGIFRAYILPAWSGDTLLSIEPEE